MASISGRGLACARGAEVIEEVAGFIEGMEFDEERGAYARGRHAVVMVSPDLLENGTFSATVTCRAFGHRAVDWQTLPVFVARQRDKAIERLTFLDERGVTILRDLPSGAYYLLTSPCYSLPVATPEDAPRCAPRGPDVRETFLASSPIILPAVQRFCLCDPFEWRLDRGSHKPAGPPGIEQPAAPHVFASSDGRLTATVVRTAEGKVRVDFETSDESLAGAVVHFAFAQTSGKVEQSGRLEVPVSTGASARGQARLGRNVKARGAAVASDERWVRKMEWEPGKPLSESLTFAFVLHPCPGLKRA